VTAYCSQLTKTEGEQGRI